MSGTQTNIITTTTNEPLVTVTQEGARAIDAPGRDVAPYSPPTELVNFRRNASTNLRRDSMEIPLVDSQLGTDSDMDLLQSINGNEELRSWRRSVLSAIAGNRYNPDLFPTIIREMDLRTTALVVNIVSTPITPNTLYPISNLITIAFALGYPDTASIVQDIISNLPEHIQSPDFDTLRRNLENVTNVAGQETQDADNRARAEVERAAAEGRERRNAALARYFTRIALGGGILAAAAGLIIGVLPRVLGGTSLGRLAGSPQSTTTTEGTGSSVSNNIGNIFVQIGEWFRS